MVPRENLFTGLPTVAPAFINDNSTLTKSMTVSGVTGAITDVNIGVSLDHTWDADLRLTLIAPDGTRVTLANGNGGSGDNFRTTFDDSAANSLYYGSAPFNGSYRPIQPLSMLNGKSANGTWTLEISDLYARDIGYLNSFSLDIHTIYTASTTKTYFDLPITGVPGNITDVDVSLGITHTRDADLDVYLIGPNPSGGAPIQINLFNDRDGTDFTNTTLDQGAGASILSGSGSYSGSYRPVGSLDAFNGADPNTTWKLVVEDDTYGAVGAINNWSLTLRTDNPAYSNLTVNGLSGQIIDVNVTVDISHANDSDVEVHLVSPTGVDVLLFKDVGGSGDNFAHLTFDDDASQSPDNILNISSVSAGAPTANGTYHPMSPLSAFDGLYTNGTTDQINGTWKLKVTDHQGNVVGTINRWSLQISTNPVYSAISVSGIPGNIVDLDVSLTIDHPNDQDLDVFLIGPDNTRIELFTDVGGTDNSINNLTNDNFWSVLLDDEAVVPINSGVIPAVAPFTGRFKPEGSLAAFDQKNPNGTWKIEITDDRGSVVGYLRSWSLHITYQPQEVTLPSIVASAPVGLKAAFAGDINGDGLDDMLFSSPAFLYTPNSLGRAYLLLGRETAPNSGFGTVTVANDCCQRSHLRWQRLLQGGGNFWLRRR
ncbi:MAG: proprotein convertase P-domain-containing protein [Candidatus Omnitrophica bacterium]|nr:proprotein convertase P-domain-containing protein [Candidatus Omnitrophota bacterium]